MALGVSNMMISKKSRDALKINTEICFNLECLRNCSEDLYALNKKSDRTQIFDEY